MLTIDTANMVRKAKIGDIPSIIYLLHQVNMVHHVIRPDLFKPNTTKYDEQELRTLLDNDNKPIFIYDDGEVLGHAFCMITEVRDDKLLQNIKTLYIDDICVMKRLVASMSEELCISTFAIMQGQ